MIWIEECLPVTLRNTLSPFLDYRICNSLHFPSYPTPTGDARHGMTMQRAAARRAFAPTRGTPGREFSGASVASRLPRFKPRLARAASLFAHACNWTINMPVTVPWSSNPQGFTARAAFKAAARAGCSPSWACGAGQGAWLRYAPPSAPPLYCVYCAILAY